MWKSRNSRQSSALLKASAALSVHGLPKNNNPYSITCGEHAETQPRKSLPLTLSDLSSDDSDEKRHNRRTDMCDSKDDHAAVRQSRFLKKAPRQPFTSSQPPVLRKQPGPSASAPSPDPSSDLSMRGRRFVKKRVEQKTVMPQLQLSKNVGIDSDEEDMRKLLGGSSQSPSPPPVPSSKWEEFLRRTPSPVSAHSQVSSLQELYVDNHSTSEKLDSPEDFRINVMTFDDLGVTTVATTEKSTEKEHAKTRPRKSLPLTLSDLSSDDSDEKRHNRRTDMCDGKDDHAAVRQSRFLKKAPRQPFTSSQPPVPHKQPGPSASAPSPDPSSELSMRGRLFVKKRAEQKTVMPQLQLSKNVGIDSDEEDMRKLLGGSSQSPSPPPVPSSKWEEFLRHTPSPVSAHSQVSSLQELYVDNHSTSEKLDSPKDFRINVMTFDDLGVTTVATTEKSAEKVGHHKESNQISRLPSAASVTEGISEEMCYKSDFESLEEHLSDVSKPQDFCVSEVQSSFSKTPKRPKTAGQCESGRKRKEPQSDMQKPCSSRSSSQSSPTISGKSMSSARVKRDVSHVNEAAVQTEPVGFISPYSSGSAALDPWTGFTYQDPAHITTNISALGEEATAAHNACMMTLNEMVRQQLALTRHFVESSKSLHTSTLEALGPPNYRYTTLQDTKEFIRTHRPSTLTMEKAMKKVAKEMKAYHCT